MSELLDQQVVQPAGLPVPPPAYRAPLAADTFRPYSMDQLATQQSRGNGQLARQCRTAVAAELATVLGTVCLAMVLEPAALQRRAFMLVPVVLFLVSACCYGVFERSIFDRCRWTAWRQAALVAVAGSALAAVAAHLEAATLAGGLAGAAAAALAGRAAREAAGRLQSIGTPPLTAVAVHASHPGALTVMPACGPLPGLRVIATIQMAGPAGSNEADERSPERVLAELEDLITRSRPDVLLAVPGAEMDAAFLQRLDWLATDCQVPLCLWLGLRSASLARLRLEAGSTGPVVSVRRPGYRRAAALAVKDVLERLLATAALLVVGLPMLGLGLLIRTTSAGPALFRQERVGFSGRLFRMCKFRTMSTDAEARLPQLVDLNVHTDGPLFKAREDPRVTPLGRRLRRGSLDELPQLLNIVRGQMALIGPRPALPAEVARYDPATRRRLLVKPGLTGLWQVSGRAELSWAESRWLDLYYVDNWSWRIDLHILWRTVGAVLFGRGAF